MGARIGRHDPGRVGEGPRARFRRSEKKPASAPSRPLYKARKPNNISDIATPPCEEQGPVLLVKTSVRQSPIHGLGLFAEEHIPAGTTLWRFEPMLDRLIPESDLSLLPGEVVEFIDIYSEYFPELGVLVLSGDNDRYTNHSDDPNTEVVLPNGPEAHVRAVRDIQPGEEITCDYTVIRCRAHPVAQPAYAAATAAEAVPALA